jgi:hypothetical protein
VRLLVVGARRWPLRGVRSRPLAAVRPHPSRWPWEAQTTLGISSCSATSATAARAQRSPDPTRQLASDGNKAIGTC